RAARGGVSRARARRDRSRRGGGLELSGSLAGRASRAKAAARGRRDRVRRRLGRLRGDVRRRQASSAATFAKLVSFGLEKKKRTADRRAEQEGSEYEQ